MWPTSTSFQRTSPNWSPLSSTEPRSCVTNAFRRWPSLSRRELSELKRLYDGRLRVARYMGSRSRRSL